MKSLSVISQQHGKDQDGLAWYRTRFKLPPGAEGKRLVLLFGAVDEGATVWLNGRLVGEHPFLKPSDWYAPFEMEITEQVHFDQPNVLVVLVEDRVGLGGVWKKVRVVRQQKTSGILYVNREGKSTMMTSRRILKKEGLLASFKR